MKSPSFSLLKKRLKGLLNQLDILGVDGCVVDAPVDLGYLTGLSLSTGWLIALKGEYILFVDGRYLQVAREKSPVPVRLLEEKNIQDFTKGVPFAKCAFDAQTTSFAEYQKLQKRLPKYQLIEVDGLLKELRLIKDTFEQDALRRSAKLLWKGFQHLRKKIKSGITEKDLALEFEIFCRKQGAEKLAFDPIIAFGPNSAMPHYRSQDVGLKKGDVILVDIGVVVDNYRSDMTRTLFFGTPDPLLKKWQKIVKKAHDAALDICRPGVKLGELDAAARSEMTKEGVEVYYIHSLGHGVGLEIHEYPRIKVDGADKDLPLQPGMVITVEPGLYLPGKGGIRYEDTIIVTKTGYENFYR
ncbi:MAG: M24 family metallopeptidase [Chlamydiales bacterium]